MSQASAGFRPLLKVSLVQDRLKIAPWVVLITALSVSSVLAYGWVFPDQASRAELAATIGANPALALIFGPARDLSTADGFNAWRAGQLGAFFAGLMAILIVIRNSRAQEDSGQAELLASAAMGRQTRLAVAVAMAVVASLALGVVATVATTLFGGGFADSAALAASWAASGCMFGAAAAVAAQLGSDARSATFMSVGFLGACSIARGFIDSSGSGEWALWLTPFGWLEQVRPAAGNRVWPLLVALAFTLISVGLAFALHARRDYGMGLIPPRPGPARGAAALTNPWGLALRLNRGALLGWLAAFAVLGVVFGVLATSIGEVFTENPAIAAALGAGEVTQAQLLFTFVVTILSLVGIIAAVFGVGIVMRAYAEEADWRTDPLLAGSLTRARQLAGSAALAMAAVALAMLLAGALIGLVAAAREPVIAASDVLRQAVVTIPAVWVLVALAIAAYGARPAARLMGWLAIVATFALTILGPVFNLWDWVLGISPMWHVPAVNAPRPDWTGLAWLALVATLLITLGFAGYRRRDIAVD
jgi:ABC-2 type transport system permease protein